MLALLMMLRNERGWRAVVVWMDPRLCLPRLADRGVPVTREAWAFVLAWRECASWDRRSMGKSSPSVQLTTLRARRTPWGIPLGVVGPDEAFEKLVMDVGKWRAGALLVLRTTRGWRAVVVGMDPRLCLAVGTGF